MIDASSSQILIFQLLELFLHIFGVNALIDRKRSSQWPVLILQYVYHLGTFFVFYIWCKILITYFFTNMNVFQVPNQDKSNYFTSHWSLKNCLMFCCVYLWEVYVNKNLGIYIDFFNIFLKFEGFSVLLLNIKCTF